MDMDLRAYQTSLNDYDQLSLKDLLDAQDLYHIHLMRHPNVVATAIGRYRIRIDDSWPDHQGAGKVHGTDERTLENSEVRPYSWPAILVFVNQWIPPSAFYDGGGYNPDQIVPKTLYLPDGRRIPVCVIKAPREAVAPPAAPINFPLNNIGGGRPILASVQGQRHVATIACLVRDGHKTYALTNRHVTGETGEVVYTQRQGRIERVGVTAAKQLTRMKFMELYPGFVGNDVFVNLDVGLIDVDRLEDWTAQIEGIGAMGPMFDVSVYSLSLALIGCWVQGHGAASGIMKGEIQALFYRYKSQGGFDYIADLFIGPRSVNHHNDSEHSDSQPTFSTHPGDSGTLFLLEPQPLASETRDQIQASAKPASYLPIGMQWGANLLGSAGNSQSYALATCLSTVCNLLDVDLVRDWNLDQPNTWGAVGHFSIATSVIGALSSQDSKLAALMKNNATLIAPDDGTIRNGEFKGLGDEANVPLADVPDFYWKPRLSHQGHTRPFEGPNHFADMDQKNEVGEDLLTLCENPKNIDPNFWNDFYESVTDILTGEKISKVHRGLLPFRVWQIFDEMVRFAREGKAPEFVCAAGVLTHYLGDSCQPLHVSYLHDGDPFRHVTRTVHHRNGVDEDVTEPLGKGVHAAYEDDMVNAHRGEILDALQRTLKVNADELIADGFSAAQKTIELMRSTFSLLSPTDIVQAFIDFDGKPKARAEFFWTKFGTNTIKVMQNGTHLLAVLWESAWAAGQGEVNVLDPMIDVDAMGICGQADFLESYTIDQIGAHLTRSGENE